MHQWFIYYKYRKNTYQYVENLFFIQYFATKSHFRFQSLFPLIVHHHLKDEHKDVLTNLFTKRWTFSNSSTLDLLQLASLFRRALQFLQYKLIISISTAFVIGVTMNCRGTLLIVPDTNDFFNIITDCIFYQTVQQLVSCVP